MGTANMNAEMTHEGVERRMNVGRVPDQQSDETERLQAVLLANKESEMRATCSIGAMLDDAVVRRERDRVFGIVEQLHVDPCLGQDLHRVHAETLEQRGDDQRGSHAHRRARRR
jgi:hypothetical protein